MFDLIYRFDPVNALTNKLPTSSEEACEVLMQGNHEFAQLTDPRTRQRRTSIIPIDPRAFGWDLIEHSAPTQAPFAAVLGCADARVPTEMVMKSLWCELPATCSGKSAWAACALP
jgi:carbonic anhydrase